MALFDEQYWTHKYEQGNTGWDIGDVSTPIKEFIDQLTDRSIQILIPGAGNAHEAEYLWRKGFLDTTIVDLSEKPLEAFQKRIPDFPSRQLIQADFFEHNTKYDLIIEQTFFCALEPRLRQRYLKKMSTLLKPTGRLVGLLFNIPLFADHPPFGGHKSEYLPMFEQVLKVNRMEEAYNSIPQRKGNELWIDLGLK